MPTILSKFRDILRAFCRAREGNVAVIFGLAAIPIIGFVGAAVDYGRANSVKTAMQSALDATALMLSHQAAGMSQDDLNSKALTYFLALFHRADATDITIKASYSTDGGTNVKITGNAYVPTEFVRVIGFDNIAVGVNSVAKWGSNRLRVALVLDNTGSMADAGKIDALKTATTNLLAQLKGAASVDGDVYVSIVPFVKDVSVDPSNYSSSWDSWIYWDDTAHTDTKSWDALNGTCSVSGKSNRASCQAYQVCSISGYTDQASCQAAGLCSVGNFTTQGSCTGGGVCSISTYTTQSNCQGATGCTNPGQTTQNSCTSNNACSNSSYTSRSSCQSHGATWGRGTWGRGTWTAGVWTPGVWTAGVWTHKDHSTWNGCFTDRGTATAPGTNAGPDQDMTPPSTSIAGTTYPAEQYGSCPKSVIGLNYDWTTMNSLVASMSPNGSTNQPIGLVWGWLSLAGGGPFTVPAKDPNYQYSEVIILLSDGLNTQDRWYGNGSSTSTQVDTRMYDSSTGNGTCANIKAAGVTIYTIQVNTGGDPTSTLLQNCASNTAGTSDHFFLLTSADQMVTTFQKIGTNLTKLRVAQ